MRRVAPLGFTLHELIISLALTGAILALACGAALGQLKFFRGVGEVVAMRSQIGHATTVGGNVLRAVANSSDILLALDSAFEAEVTVGAGFQCATDTGRLTVTAPAEAWGNSLGSYFETPQLGDAAHVAIEDSARTSWIRLHLAVGPSGDAGCVIFPTAPRAWRIRLQEQLVVGAGSAIRFTRRTRLSLYRASDDRWYLGLKDWNAEAQRFNTIQPVAGPLRPYSSDPARTGLLFEYRDAAGTLLSPPANAPRIATITIVARSETPRPVRTAGLISAASPRYADSLAVSVSFRHRP